MLRLLYKHVSLDHPAKLGAFVDALESDPERGQHTRHLSLTNLSVDDQQATDSMAAATRALHRVFAHCTHISLLRAPVDAVTAAAGLNSDTGL